MDNATVVKRDLDLPTLLLAIAMTAIGVLAIYSATYDIESGTVTGFYRRQLLWGGLALVTMLVTATIPLRVLYAAAYPTYAACLVPLVAVLLMPSPTPTKRWIFLGSLGVQPSEFAKIGTVLGLARYLCSRTVDLGRVRFWLVPAGLAALPMALVLKEPDLGTSLIFAALLLPVLYWAGMKAAHLFFLLVPALSAVTSFHWFLWLGFLVLLCGVFVVARPRVWAIILVSALALGAGVATPSLYDSLHEYQRERIETFMDPSKDPLGSGYQIIQSKVAIGSGGLYGKGFLKGTQTKLAFLPNQHTDFIFSVIGEEVGFIGGLVVLGLYLLLFWRGIILASEAVSRFAGLIAIGALSILVFHVFINVGMAVGMAPVTGLPLPFLSYGGSSLIVSYTVVGLLLNVGLHRYEY